LSKGSASAPLDAAGTFSTALRAASKVVEKLLQMSSIFRLVNVLSLIAVLSFGIMSESRAYDISGDCGQGKVACGTSCVDAGETCYFYDDNGRVKEIVSSSSHSRWDSQNEPGLINRTVLYYDDEGKLTGGRQYASGSVNYDNIELTIHSTDDGFLLTPNTSGSGYTLVLDNSGRVLRDGYQTAQPYGYDEVKSYTYDNDGNMTSQTNVSCSGSRSGTYDTGISSSNSNCATSGSPQAYTYVKEEDENIVAVKFGDQIVAKYGYSDGYLAKQKGIQSDKKCSAAGNCTSCYSGLLQGGKCVASCGASFRLNDGECDRIRYTPAEAAQYLKDTDNEIIMTFKVNR
jgi:hypothetical protein